jgi:hypothetical protein
MPGIIAASWASDQRERVELVFHRACECYTMLKGLTCKSQAWRPGYSIARFPRSNSLCPDIYQTEDKRLIFAGAGWWFDPDAQQSKRPNLECLANRYRTEKEKVLHRLEGQYLIIAGESQQNKLIAWSDPLGMFPVYVAESDGIAWCSTSALALAVALERPLDTEALRGLFMDGAIRSPRSAFEGIRRIGIGEQVVLADGNVQITRVWSPFHRPRKYRKLQDAAEEGLMLLQRSCRHIYQTWPDCVSDLTAGLDSRLVVAVIANLGFPIRVTVSGHQTELDVTMARQIAKHFQWPLKHFAEPSDWGHQRWELFKQGVALAEGELSGSAIDGTIRDKLALSDLFDAAVSGCGGELYRDFFWQQEFFKVGKTSELDLSRVFHYRFLFSGRPRMSLFRKNWLADYIDDQMQTAQRVVDLEPDALNTAKLDALYLWKCSGSFARYSGAICPIIASPLPLLSPSLFEYSVSVPWRYRVRGRLIRQIITRAHPELAKMPTWYGGSAEPMRITRPQNYLPYAATTFKKLVRKIAQVTIRHPIFRQPCERKRNPLVNKDFVSVLGREGFLNIENLRTAQLYDGDGLREFLSRAHEVDFRDFSQLYVVVTVELLSRMSELKLRAKSPELIYSCTG